jgi:translation initiation factor 4G
MYQDIVDLRKKGWKSKDSAAKGPATLEEIRQQAMEAERQKDLQRAQDNSRRGGGGGGRPGVGRGDARNFSGGGGQFMPPPDYNRNTVGMDDLRRLGRGGSRQASTQGPTLGPTSMFGPRGSNTRKPMGPGGLLSRGAEDSGASSRTATPPQQKKDETTSVNAFR